jgi:hypothetical protein
MVPAVLETEVVLTGNPVLEGLGALSAGLRPLVLPGESSSPSDDALALHAWRLASTRQRR